jgi:hypothetical protein
MVKLSNAGQFETQLFPFPDRKEPSKASNRWNKWQELPGSPESLLFQERRRSANVFQREVDMTSKRIGGFDEDNPSIQSVSSAI